MNWLIRFVNEDIGESVEVHLHDRDPDLTLSEAIAQATAKAEKYFRLAFGATTSGDDLYCTGWESTQPDGSSLWWC